MSVIEDVSRLLESIAAPYALIGGRAVGARGYVRATFDYDFLTTDRRVLLREVWKEFEDRGASVDPRKGDFDDPIAGVVHIRFEEGGEADVLLAKWKWEQAVIERAERIDVGGTEVPVPRTSDLILLKLAAGGPIDQQDIVSLLATNRDQLIREVEEHLPEVRPDVTEEWNRIKLSTF
jgi:hypothetical protein